jgi:hypothetical protein
MPLDRLNVRRTVGAAVERIRAAEEVFCFHQHTELTILHRVWRELAASTDRARVALEAAEQKFRHAAADGDKDVIAAAKRAHPDIACEGEGHEALPLVCMVTKLAVFADDPLYGDRNAGFVVLRDAVRASPCIADIAAVNGGGNGHDHGHSPAIDSEDDADRHWQAVCSGFVVWLMERTERAGEVATALMVA